MRVLHSVITICILILIIGCANNGTSTGNPLVNLRYGSFSSSLSAFTVNQAKFCFKRVRFKQAGELTNSDPAVDGDNVDFDIGEKTLNAVGDNLGNITVPPAVYTRIEFDLDNHCGNGYSVYLVNTSGTFSTNDTISIKFEGNVVLNSDVSLNLALQNLISALNTVSSSTQIRTKLEAASGSY